MRKAVKGADPHRGPAFALALLLLTMILAGCSTEPPSPPVRARPGDFVVVDLAALDETGREVLNWSGQRAFMGEHVPSRLPAGWDANSTEALPPGVVFALTGASPGAALDPVLLRATEAFGARSQERTISAPIIDAAPREHSLPREAVDLGPPAMARWAGRDWQVEVLDAGANATRVVLLAGPPEGALLELPAYWNDHYQLWRSRFLGFEGGANGSLRVEHLPREGSEVLVGGVLHRVRVEEAGPLVHATGDPVGTVTSRRVVADGNPPLAGLTLRFRVTLLEVAFPGSAGHPVAPDALLVRLDGGRFNLSDLRGQPVLLDFFATWCVTCLQQTPILARAHAAFPNLTILSVTADPTDTADRVRAFQAEAAKASRTPQGAPLPVDWTFAFDPTGDASRNYAVTTLPREVLVDADGRIRAASAGVHPWEDLERELQDVLTPSGSREGI